MMLNDIVADDRIFIEWKKNINRNENKQKAIGKPDVIIIIKATSRFTYR